MLNKSLIEWQVPGRRFDVDEKQVHEWKLQKAKLKQLCITKIKPKKRLLGPGGKARLGKLQEHLVS